MNNIIEQMLSKYEIKNRYSSVKELKNKRVLLTF